MKVSTGFVFPTGTFFMVIAKDLDEIFHYDK